jgi:hypothetical protein
VVVELVVVELVVVELVVVELVVVKLVVELVVIEVTRGLSPAIPLPKLRRFKTGVEGAKVVGDEDPVVGAAPLPPPKEIIVISTS